MKALLTFLVLLASALLAHAGFSTVVLDAGHGGHDRGGIPGQRYAEKAMTLDVARRVRALLQASGLRVVMTRDSDDFIPLGTRTAIANAQRNAVFVSIHFNSAPRRGAHGFETYYYTSQSARLAAAIHARVITSTWSSENRGLRRRGFFVIRRTRIPAVLVEGGFLTNPTEGAIIASAANRQRLANAVAAGILSRR